MIQKMKLKAKLEAEGAEPEAIEEKLKRAE